MVDVISPISKVTETTTVITRWSITPSDLEMLIRAATGVPSSSHVSFEILTNDWNDPYFGGVEITHHSETKDINP